MKLASSLFSAAASCNHSPLSLPPSPPSPGTAIRHCDEHKGWLPPNLFNCTSTTFSKLKLLVCNFAVTESPHPLGFIIHSCWNYKHSDSTIPQMSGDLIRIRVKVKMFDPKMSGLLEELLKMSAPRKSRYNSIPNFFYSSLSPVRQILP